MQTTPEIIIHWQGAAVVLCLSIVPLRYRDKMITLDTKAGQDYRLNGELKF